MTAADALGAALGDRFVIERELGRGGMAIVYLATDTRYGRRVALKVLHDDLAASLAAERFRREIRIATALTHPNILPLHEAGESVGDGPLFFVMPYVEGDTLRTRLSRGPLPIADATRIASEVAGALDYAHRRGIVHRDIKPENILLLEGHAVVTDFGIARAVDEAGGGTLTATGVILGTPAYLSPEQIDGIAEIDGRSDVFSLGTVLYEMLTGSSPFAAATAGATVARISNVSAAPVTAVRGDVSPALAATVGKALARDRDDRFQTAGEFARALSGMPHHDVAGHGARRSSRKPIALAIGAAVVVILGIFASRIPALRGSDETPSIAILPFATDRGDTANAYLGSSIAEQILDALADAPGLRVRSRTSSFNIDPAGNISDIARRLRATAVLEGSVSRVGAGLHVTARLLDPSGDSPLWAATFDEPLSNVSDLQERIAKNIVHALRVRLASDTMTLVHRRSRSAEAQDLVLRARYVARGLQRDGLVAASQLLARAGALDSTFADVPVEQARIYQDLGVFHDQNFVPGERDAPPADLVRQAYVAAQRALRLDPRSASAHTAVGELEFRYQWNWQAAERELRLAVALNPSSATGYVALSRFLRSMGRFGEARAALDSALRLDSESVALRAYGRISYFSHDFPRAVQETESDTRRTERTWADWLAEELTQTGRYAKAESLFMTATDAPEQVSGLIWLYAKSGRLQRARALLASPIIHNQPTLYAGVLVATGDTARALDEIDRAVALRDPLVVDLAVDPRLDALRQMPRFIAVLRRLGLPMLALHAAATTR